MHDTVLETVGLHAWYGRQPALRDVSLSFTRRTVTAVIGPSGCGKSTLLRCVNRLLETNRRAKVSGRVLLNGDDIYAPDADVMRVRARIGLIAQRPQVLPMSIYDNVAYGPRIHGARRRQDLDVTVERCLRVVGLWDEVSDRLPASASALSVGQQQRLCLARGLAVSPDVILGDEPTSALDPASGRIVEELLLSLRKSHAVILVTHSIEQARRLADHVVLLDRGKVVEFGPAVAFFHRPREEFTRRYLTGTLPHAEPVAASHPLRTAVLPRVPRWGRMIRHWRRLTRKRGCAMLGPD